MIVANCKLKIPTSVEAVFGGRGIFIPGVSALLGLKALWPLTHMMANHLVILGARQLYGGLEWFLPP